MVLARRSYFSFGVQYAIRKAEEILEKWNLNLDMPAYGFCWWC